MRVSGEFVRLISSTERRSVHTLFAEQRSSCGLLAAALQFLAKALGSPKESHHIGPLIDTLCIQCSESRPAFRVRTVKQRR